MPFMANATAMLKNLIENGIFFHAEAGVPVDGASGTGAGVMGLGSLIYDTTGRQWYQNVGTKAVPNWDAALVAPVALREAAGDGRGRVAGLGEKPTQLPADKPGFDRR